VVFNLEQLSFPGKTLSVEYSLRNLRDVDKMKTKTLYIDGSWVKSESSCLLQIKQQFMELSQEETENEENEENEDEDEEEKKEEEKFSVTFDFLVEEVLKFSKVRNIFRFTKKEQIQNHNYFGFF
jgi:exopolysaccharide biosynthesis protein